MKSKKSSAKQPVQKFRREANLTRVWAGRMKKRGKVRSRDLESLKQRYFAGKIANQQQKSASLTDDLDVIREQESEYFDRLVESYGMQALNEETSSSSEDAETESCPQRKRAKTKSGDQLLEAKFSGVKFDNDEQQNELKHFLPIKTQCGKVLKVAKEMIIKTDDEQEQHVKSGSEGDEQPDQKTDEPMTTSKLFAKRAKMIEQYKADIALKAASIMENPQENTGKLKRLVEMSHGLQVEPLVQFTVQKLATASLLEVFVDIIPSYYIRPWTEVEEKQQMKKETRRLHEYEESLLRNYQKYLKRLNSFSKYSVNKKLNNVKLTPKSVETCQLLGVKCACKLLSDHYHFNFRTDLLNFIVPLMNSPKNETIRNLTCESVESVFKNDILGQASLDAVKIMCKFVKNNPSKTHPRMLETFLQLKIKEIERSEQKSRTKRDLLAKKRKIKMMSRKERKMFKRLKRLDDELQDLEAEEKQENILKFHTRIMNQIFAVYFRVLKREVSSSAQAKAKCKLLLAPVLKGLSKFACLINVEFFDDLFHSLLMLVQRGTLNTTDSLHCVKTAFIILSGEGQALNIDPCGFYRFVYSVLPKIAEEKRKDLRHWQLGAVLECLDYMLNKRRKQVTINRIAAFVKRLAFLAVKFDDEEITAILLALRTYFITHPKLESLIDEESLGVGSQLCLANTDDPDRCNAQMTCIIDDVKKVQGLSNDRTVKRLCAHVLNGLPSQGVHSIGLDLTSKLPWSLLRPT